jgi:hypothetical protein
MKGLGVRVSPQQQGMLFDWPQTYREAKACTWRESSALRCFHGISDGQKLGQRECKAW